MSRRKPAFGTPERIALCKRHRPVAETVLATGVPTGRVFCWFCGAKLEPVP